MAWAYLQREGMVVNHKRVYRVWRKGELCLPRRCKHTRKKNGIVRLQPPHADPV